MLTYSFSNLGTDSLYEHLYKCIKNDIIDGTLRINEKLPSKRTFAQNLGVSIITVENAYTQLMAEGYIYSIPKKGFFVSEIKTIKKEQTASALSQIQEVAFIPAQPKYFANFASNQTNINNFPFSIWAKIVREILNENQQELVTNPPSGGILALRKAIAKHLKDFRNIDVTPEQIIVGAGTEYLYGLLIQLLGFEKKYAVENPGYSKISLIYKKHNVSCDFISMDKSGVQIDVLEKVIYINTFTKTLASTVRISYMVLPKHLLHKFYSELSFYSCTVSNFEQYTLARFIDDGYFEKHISRMRNYYHTKRDTLLDIIKNSPLAPYVTIREENSGLHFLMKLNTTLSDSDFCIAAEKKE